MVRRLVVMINRDERGNAHGMIEGEYHSAAEIVFVRLIDETVAVSVPQVVGEYGDISNAHPEIIVELRISTV